MQTCYLAVDIGASSGRHIIGTVEHGVWPCMKSTALKTA